MSSYDVTVIGGGAIGFGTVLGLQRRNPYLKIALIEKDDVVSNHQTSPYRWDEYNHIDRRIEESLRGGRKIEAIKTYRKHKIDNDGDCSLKQAKEYIDKLIIKMGID